MKKILYLDTETTGVSPERNAIVQLSGIIEIDGEVKERFNFTIAPFEKDEVEDGALRVTGLTRELIAFYPAPHTQYLEIVKLFDKYIDRFNKNDKFYPAGYNTRFDIDFLSQFFKKNGNAYFGSYCNWRGVDALAVVHFFNFMDGLTLPNYKLSTVCAHYGIEIQAHDAMSDIEATRHLIYHLKKMFQSNEA